MPRHVARCVDRAERQRSKVDLVALFQQVIGRKDPIHPLAAARQPLGHQPLHQGGSARVGGSEAIDLGARHRGNPWGKGRVVQMRVGHKDRGNLIAGGKGGAEGVKMGRIVRAGINDRHLTASNKIGVRAASRHGRRVARPHALHVNPHSRPFRNCPVGANLPPMRLHLKSLLPRGLFGRAALILLVPVVAIQLIVSVVFIQRHFEGVTRQMTTSIQIEISHLLSVVNAAPDLATGQQRGAEIGAALELQVTLPGADAPAEDLREFIDWSGREVILTLRAGLPELISADLISGDREVRAWFQTRYGPIRVALDRRRLSASNPHQLLVLMVFASVLMTGVAYVFLRNQLTPIARMAQAAEAFGKGEIVPFRPRGATEVRAAGQAFLDMRLRIERQIEARTQMLSGVSHDLRTPLTRLKLGLSFLPEDDEVEALKRDVQQMERMVDEFLSFARGDAMEEPAAVDPADFLAQVVADAVRAGQAVSLGPVDWPGGTVRLRPEAVRRALENLLGNAARHGTRASVSLSASDRLVRMVVEDDGPGIPEPSREAAMEPFRRLDAARNPNRGGGVGLGLAIAADIARSHGGALRLGQSESLGGLRAELSLAR